MAGNSFVPPAVSSVARTRGFNVCASTRKFYNILRFSVAGLGRSFGIIVIYLRYNLISTLYDRDFDCLVELI